MPDTQSPRDMRHHVLKRGCLRRPQAGLRPAVPADGGVPGRLLLGTPRQRGGRQRALGSETAFVPPFCICEACQVMLVAQVACAERSDVLYLPRAPSPPCSAESSWQPCSAGKQRPRLYHTEASPWFLLITCLRRASTASLENLRSFFFYFRAAFCYVILKLLSCGLDPTFRAYGM